MDNNEKLENFLQELMRLLSKYEFTLWSYDNIVINDYNNWPIADVLDIEHKENILTYDLYDFQTQSYIRGEYYESKIND